VLQSEPAPSKIAIWFCSNLGFFGLTEAKFAKILNRETSLVERINAHGFERNDNGKHLVVPIRPVAPELLAQAFENDDFDEALAPVREAVSRATSLEAFNDLTSLIEIVERGELKIPR